MDEDRPLPVELPAPVLKQAQRRISWPQTVNVRFPSMGITGRANREGRISTHCGHSYPQKMRHSTSQLAQLLWHATLYRVSPPGVRDVPCLIRWQARVNPCLEPLGIACRDGGDDRAYVSRLQAGRPAIIEIGE